jgi:GMP synthase-like glutamine amidotransferase
MILIVGMEKPQRYFEGAVPGNLIGRFERMTRCAVMVAHYSTVRPEWLREYPIKAVFITGFGYPWQEFEVSQAVGLWDFLHEVEVPVLGACGGHQLLGFVFSKDFRRVKKLRDLMMRKLRPGEPALYPTYRPGYFVELGMFPVQVVKRDAIFEGLPKTIMVYMAHACEVREIPRDFQLLASNENCRVQAMRHKTKPIYGTQFHAENWTDYYWHGRRVIENFFRIAGLVK